MANNPGYTDFYKQLSQCVKEWKDPDSSGIYVAWGNSDFFIDKTTSSFKSIKSNSLKISYDRHDSKEINLDNFENIWHSAGMFDDTEIHVIDHIEANKTFWKFLETIPAKDNVNNHILFTFQGAKILSKFKQQFDRLEVKLIPCFNPSKFEYKKISNDLCRKHKLNLSQEGNDFLVHCIGEDLFQLENEIKKLSLIFPPDKKNLSSNDLAPYMEFLREDHAFQLTDFLIKDQSAAAQSLITDLITRGESSIAILGILTRHIRNTLLIGHALKSGKNINSLSKEVRLPQFVIKSYNQYVKKIDLRKAAIALTLCQGADIKLKSSNANEELVLGEIIAAIN